MGTSRRDEFLKNFPVAWACVLVLAGILITGLWPFTFFPRNRVEWLQGENGIRFQGRGLVSGIENGSDSSPRFLGRNPLAIELWLKPKIEPDRNLPVVLSIYNDKSLEAITIAQWRSALILRWKNLGTPLKFKEFGLENALRAGERTILTMAFDGSTTTVFVDGKLKRQYPSNPLSNLDTHPVRFVLGNAPNGRDAWTGDVFALALYDRSLSRDEVSRNYEGWVKEGLPAVSTREGLAALFLFAEGTGATVRDQIRPDDFLLIPKSFQPLQREILIPPWKDFRLTRSYVQDMAVNMLGFLPFGFFFAAWFTKSSGLSRRTAFLSTTLIAVTLSLSIELIQAWIPLRDSQVMDVLMNTLGAAVGSLLSAVYPREGRDQSCDFSPPS